MDDPNFHSHHPSQNPLKMQYERLKIHRHNFCNFPNDRKIQPMKIILLVISSLFMTIAFSANTAAKPSSTSHVYISSYSYGYHFVRMDFRGDEVFALLSGGLSSCYHFTVDKEVKGSRHMSITIGTKLKSRVVGTQDFIRFQEKRISLGHYEAGRWGFTIFVNGNRYFEILELKY